MKWRCLNDIFGYCTGEPDFKQKPGSVHYPVPWDGVTVTSCKLNTETCGKHQTLTENIAAMTAVKPGGAGK